MKHINKEKIAELIAAGKKAGKNEYDAILLKARNCRGLALSESAALLSINDQEYLNKIFETALFVKNSIYGRRIVLFAPLYISSDCENNCLYCGFRSENKNIGRKTLSLEEIEKQTLYLINRGHKRILMVSGEIPSGKINGSSHAEYYTKAIQTIYKTTALQSNKPQKIRRVNVNLPAMNEDSFKLLKSAGIGTYQLFQETYHDETYKSVHRCGPKSNPDNRIDAISMAMASGIDDIGIGVLYGLYDYEFETIAMLMHIEHLEKKFGIGPHTVSVPRIQRASGSELSNNVPYRVTDEDFKKLIAVLRLSVPYTGIILTTRESPQLRDELLEIGVSQISAESKIAPGGYSGNNESVQFSLHDERCISDVVLSLLRKGFIPSFCASCYRRDRTGETFMNLAKPGTIRKMCDINAIVTLKEYLTDYAPSELKTEGSRFIDEAILNLDEKEKNIITPLLSNVEKGERDQFI